MAADSFEIAVKSTGPAPAEDVWKNFYLRIEDTDDREGPYWYVDPTEDEIALYTMIFAEGTASPDQLKATYEFFEAIMEEESFKQLIEDVRDPLKTWIHMTTLIPILEGITKNVTGFPTRPSSGSTSSRGRAGRTLTDHLPPAASKRSRSPRAVSATSSTPGSANS